MNGSSLYLALLLFTFGGFFYAALVARRKIDEAELANEQRQELGVESETSFAKPEHVRALRDMNETARRILAENPSSELVEFESQSRETLEEARLGRLSGVAFARELRIFEKNMSALSPQHRKIKT